MVLIATALLAAALLFTALHRGSYSLIDRQQLAVLIWTVVGAGAAAGLLPRARPSAWLWLPFVALAGVAAWAAIGLYWTESAERTYNELARIVGYMGVLALVWLGVTSRDWRRMATALPAAAVTVCALAVASRLWPSAFPADEVMRRLSTYRLSYPFGYWNALGCWAAMSVALCLAWAAHARSAAVRALALAAVPVCVLALYFTVSRAALGGLLVGSLVVIALAGNRWLSFLQALLAGAGSAAVIVAARGQDQVVEALGNQGSGEILKVLLAASACLALVAFALHRLGAGERLRMGRRSGRWAIAVGAIVGIVAVAIVAPRVAGPAWDQFNGDRPALQAGASADARLTNLSGNRVNVWKSAARAGLEHPVGGLGAGSFEFWWNRDGANREYLRDAHSIYLEAWAEGGVIGLVLLLVFLGGLLLAALQGRRALALRGDAESLGVHAGLVGVFAVFLLQAGFDWIWESTAVALLGFVAVAIAAAAASERRDGSDGSSASIAVATVLVALLAIVVELPGIAAERDLQASRQAVSAGNLEAAQTKATDAIRATPWAAAGYGQRGLVLGEAGRTGASIANLEAAERREPTNWRWPLLLSREQVERGDPVGADRSLRRAGQLRPFLRILGSGSTAPR